MSHYICHMVTVSGRISDATIPARMFAQSDIIQAAAEHEAYKSCWNLEEGALDEITEIGSNEALVANGAFIFGRTTSLVGTIQA